MIIGGLQKFSLINYPNKTSAVIFTRGCNFKCNYCHNPELVIPEQYISKIKLTNIYAFLEKRRNQLDAVCITGGEPTLHNDLFKMIKKIKKMGFLVKLDTNGTNPNMLEKLIDNKLIDYIAMDIKAPFEKYSKIMEYKIQIKDLEKCINLIITSNIDHEFRTTIVKDFTTKEDIFKIGKIIKGAQNYYLQRFVTSKMIDNTLKNATTYSENTLSKWCNELKRNIKNCEIR